MHRFFILWLFLLAQFFLCNSPARAQSDLKQKDQGHLARENSSFYNQQVRPGLIRATDKTSLHLLWANLATVTISSTQDNIAHDRWKDHQMWSQETSRWGDDYGKYAIGFFLSLGQTYFDHDNGINHLRAIIANSIVTTGLKYSVQRRRPNDQNNLSFPSGHTSDAFTTATSLTYAYGWKAAVIAYPLATFVGISRVADEAHWLSDVTAGAFVGIWMGRAFFYDAQKVPSSENNSSRNFQWQIFPVLENDQSGLRFAAEF